MYKNSLVIIRTQKDSSVECHMIFTRQYQKDNPSQFVYDGYQCSEFEIAETVGGKVIVTTKDDMNISKIPVEHRLEFDNVTKVELLTTHTIKCGASAIDPLSKCDQDNTFNYFKPEKGLPAIKFIADRLTTRWNEYVPYEFELFKDVNDNRLYIGDGKTPLSQLVGHPLKNYSMPVVPFAVDDEVYIITERDGIIKDTIIKIWSQGKQWLASTMNSNYTYNLSEDFEKVIFHDPILAYLVYQHNGLEGSKKMK